MYYIYTITNLFNYKAYVGQTQNPKHRWSSHLYEMRRGVLKYTIYKALRKYGENNFQFSLLEICQTQDEADAAEQYWISEFDSLDCHSGYNLAVGGNVNRGWHHSEESKKKISESQKGKIVIISEETKEKMSKSQMGHLVSLEAKKKISESHSGEKSYSAKLNWKLVRSIREEYKSGKINQIDLAIKYNVAKSTMNILLKNKTWKE